MCNVVSFLMTTLHIYYYTTDDWWCHHRWHRSRWKQYLVLKIFSSQKAFQQRCVSLFLMTGVFSKRTLNTVTSLSDRRCRDLQASEGLSRWLTDGASLTDSLTSCLSTAGRPLSSCTGRLILFYHFQSQSWTPDPTLVSQSPARDNTQKCPGSRGALKLSNRRLADQPQSELELWSVTAWYSPTWLWLHRPPDGTTLSSCHFSPTFQSLQQHLESQ